MHDRDVVGRRRNGFFNRDRYAELLESPLWAERRAELFESRGRKCQCCSITSGAMHVHHVRYRLGVRPWDYEDCELVILCPLCHAIAECWKDDINRMARECRKIGCKHPGRACDETCYPSIKSVVTLLFVKRARFEIDHAEA